jgi:hypothetical protein
VQRLILGSWKGCELFTMTKLDKKSASGPYPTKGRPLLETLVNAVAGKRKLKGLNSSKNKSSEKPSGVTLLAQQIREQDAEEAAALAQRDHEAEEKEEVGYDEIPDNGSENPQIEEDEW